MILYPYKSINTNNFNDFDNLNKFNFIWSNFLKEIDKRKLNNEVIYGIYTNYESNYHGNYQFSLAFDKNYFNAEENIEIPDDLTKYNIFPVKNNDKFEVFFTWKHIWKLEEEGKLNRRYHIDWEQYNSDGSIEIYISIK